MEFFSAVKLKIIILLISITIRLCVLQNNYSIAFLHMRKSGGSNILAMLTAFMRNNDCFNDRRLYVSTDGVKNGNSLQPQMTMKLELFQKLTLSPPPCPNVNIVHEEFRSVDGSQLSSLINNNIKLTSNISFITSLRDPIERIGSQAFYGTNNIAYNALQPALLNQCNSSLTEADMYTAFKSCKKLYISKINILPKDFCNCFTSTKQYVNVQLQTNESLWYNWMDRQIGFHDVYMPNYYIHRLTSFKMSHAEELEIFKKAHDCLKLPYFCSMDGYKVLNILFRGEFNTDNVYLKSPITPEILELSKTLIRDLFHVIILEKFNHPYTHKLISTALFNKYKSVTIYKGRNSGWIQSYFKIKKYADFIPPSVLKRLKKENAGDIELYNYALELFNTRASKYKPNIVNLLKKIEKKNITFNSYRSNINNKKKRIKKEFIT